MPDNPIISKRQFIQLYCFVLVAEIFVCVVLAWKTNPAAIIAPMLAANWASIGVGIVIGRKLP